MRQTDLQVADMSGYNGPLSQRKREDARSLVKDLLWNPQRAWIMQTLVLAGESLLCLLIIRYVRCESDDWRMCFES